jgi:hypothetical protein
MISTRSPLPRAHNPTHECAPVALCRLVCPIFTLPPSAPPHTGDGNPGENGASIIGEFGIPGPEALRADPGVTVRFCPPVLVRSAPPGVCHAPPPPAGPGALTAGALWAACNAPEAPLTPAPPPLVEVVVGKYASAVHSYQIFRRFPSQSRHIPTSSSAPLGRYSGSLKGKKMGNHENMSGETRWAVSG